MILNQTTRTIISQNEIICSSFLFRARGLMFRRKQNCLLIFPKEQAISLHNFFVCYPIDVIILNKDARVVEIKRNFRPFTVWKAKARGKCVLELPGLKSRIQIGDRIEVRS